MAKRPKRPRWPIATLQELAAIEGGLLLRQASCLDFFETREQAYETAREVIAGLSLNDYANTEQLAVDLADVYGVKMYGEGWYLKVTVDDDVPDMVVVVISLHPLKWSLKTNGGMVEP